MKLRDKCLLILFCIIFIQNKLIAQNVGWGMLNNQSSYSGSSISICSDSKGYIYASGLVYSSSGSNIIYWDGTSFNPLGGTKPVVVNNAIWSICMDSSGNLFAGGAFKNSNNNNYVLKWEKKTNSYYELGGKDSLASLVNIGTIHAICVDIYGNVYATGDFARRNSGGENCVAKWDKLTNKWSLLNGIFGNNVLFSDKFGSIYVEGNGTIVKCDGASLTDLGGANSLNLNSHIEAIYGDSTNNIYVGGGFTNSAGNSYIAKWDGNKWSELGGANSLKANNYISSIYVDKSNNIYATCIDNNANGIPFVAKWDGSKWSYIGLGAKIPLNKGGGIIGLYVDDIGSVYVGGDITNGTIRGIIAKYGVMSSNLNNISGRINTPINNVVKNYNINYWGSSIGDIQGDVNGNYSLIINNCGYVTHPTKNNDINKANGITTTDLVYIQSHILGKSLLNSPYKIIAADVNGDGKITTLDLVYIKRLILGLDTTFTNSTTKENRLWAFIDSSYKFPDTTNPFPYKDSISYIGLSANKTNQTFIGVKLGDVNWDWNPALAKLPSKVFVRPKKMSIE